MVDGSAGGDVGEEFRDAAGCDEEAVEESGEGGAGVEDGAVYNLDGRLDKGVNGVEEVFERMGVGEQAGYNLVAAVFDDLPAL